MIRLMFGILASLILVSHLIRVSVGTLFLLSQIPLSTFALKLILSGVVGLGLMSLLK